MMFLWSHQVLRKQPTLTADEIPALFREPGVLSGYRLPGKALVTYAFSAFQLNNETVNIWTHFIGFLVILSRTWSLVEEFGVDDPIVCPLLGFGVCALLNTAMSVLAHTFHSASPTIHYTCFQADYAGIGIYAFGGALPVFYLSATHETRKACNAWFLPVNAIFGWFCFVCCCVAKLQNRCPHSRKRKLLQILPLGFHFTMSMAPLYPRVLRCYLEGEVCDDPTLYNYGKVILIAILSALTYSSHLPEKIWPGYFDLIGQGHHVFHIVTIGLSLAHFDAAMWDILHYNEATRPDIDDIPSVLCLMSTILSLVVCSAFTIVLLRPLLLEKIRTDAKKSL